ncbi:MAG: protein tlpB [Flavobacterium sp.]|nr:protein tlpB [Flavobacterium sp.]
MKDSKNIIPWAIRIIIAILFIVSAIAKMYPSPYFAISTFEVKQLYSLGFSESVAPFFSRVLIGIELALGFLILQKHFLKNFLIPITILLLAVFVFHLTYVTYLSGGNSGNCGCFGELIPMTPIQAIIKNIIAIGLLGYLFYLMPKNNHKTENFWILTTILFATILGIFMLAPIHPPENQFAVSPVAEVKNDTIPADVTQLNENIKEVQNIKIDSSKTIKTEIVPTTIKTKSGYSKYFSNIDSGKKVLCLFVPGCEHCRATAKELTEMKKSNSNFPEISIIFMDEEANLIPEFFDFAGAKYPFRVIGVIDFWKVLGTGKDVPGVKFLKDGKEVKYYFGTADNKFDKDEFVNLIK